MPQEDRWLPPSNTMDGAVGGAVLPFPQPRVTELEDGGVEIDFDPQDAEVEDDSDHFANLAGMLLDSELASIAQRVVDGYTADEESRAAWLEIVKKGYQALGLAESTEKPAFSRASMVVDPVTLEAVLQGQARAIAEIAPPQGVCKTVVLGQTSPAIEQQAERVKAYFNFYTTEEAPEWRPEKDKMLFSLYVAGSAFQKIYYDEELERPTVPFVSADDFVVPYNCSSLRDAWRYTHRTWIDPQTLQHMQRQGIYLGDDDELDGSDVEPGVLREVVEEIEGRSPASADDDGAVELLEQAVYLDLGDDMDGRPLPYLVTVDRKGDKVLAIRRDWEEDDAKRRRIERWVHYKLIPGLGFYGYGFAHLLAGPQTALTGMLRSLMDSAAFANMQGGFKSRDFKTRDNDYTIGPGEWRDVDLTGDDIRKSFVPLPYKEPSPTMLSLHGELLGRTQRIAVMADSAVGEQQAANAPVGSVLAILEQATRVTSAIHARIHAELRSEFRILAKLFRKHLRAGYPFKVPGADMSVAPEDFDDRVDVSPVSDPGAPSKIHRVTMASMTLQAIASVPGADIRAATIRLLEAMGVDNVEELLPDPKAQPPQQDPALLLAQAELAKAQAAAGANQVRAEQVKASELDSQRDFQLGMAKVQADNDSRERIKAADITAGVQKSLINR